jgi:hypothetical protein
MADDESELVVVLLRSAYAYGMQAAVEASHQSLAGLRLPW